MSPIFTGLAHKTLSIHCYRDMVFVSFFIYIN